MHAELKEVKDGIRRTINRVRRLIPFSYGETLQKSDEYFSWNLRAKLTRRCEPRRDNKIDKSEKVNMERKKLVQK